MLLSPHPAIPRQVSPPHIIWLRIGNSKLNATEHTLRKNYRSIETIIKENKCGVIEID